MKSISFLYLILITNGFQPIYFSLSRIGNEFEAVNSIELLIIFDNIRSIVRCSILCYRNIQCRTFNYDSNSHQCYLFEGSIDTGYIISSISSSIIVGWINIDESLYYLYNSSSDQCINNRFLQSNLLSNLCQCPIHTFYNESLCLNQKYIDQQCQNDNWCRIDLNLICVQFICNLKQNSSLTFTSIMSTTDLTTTMATSLQTTSSVITTTTPITTVVTSIPITTIPQTTIITSTLTTSMFCSRRLSTNGILLSITNPSSSNYPLYDCYNYEWIATGLLSTLSFFFRHDPGGWMLDNINVYHNSSQLIINGGFETGDLTGWTRSGTCNLNIGQSYYGSYYAQSGNYYYYDPCAGDNHGDTLQQTFSTIIGQTYFISFWLTNYDCCAITEIANITIH